ncbi:MAG: GNAT family N-acetyltransferase [Eubacteriales bacterium]|nr:GNAT family N-acetyltransferase [Eubacteriales bacterium]
MIKFKTFNQLTNSELYEILRLRQEVFVLEQTCLYPDLDNLDQRCRHGILYAKANEPSADQPASDQSALEGPICAYLRILPSGTVFDTIAIGRVLVREEFRKQGLARELLLATLDYIKNSLGEKHIKLSAQQYLMDFYKSMGFRVISEGYLEDGIPHIDMEICF